MDFCQTCQQTLKTIALAEYSSYCLATRGERGISPSSLELSASKGCRTCFLLWRGIQQLPEAIQYTLNPKNFYIIERADNYWEERISGLQYTWGLPPNRLRVGIYGYRTKNLDEPIAMVEIYTLADAPPSIFCGTATSVKPNLDLEERIQTIKAWMNTCKTVHEYCPQGESKPLPRRVLDVKHAMNLQKIFLVEAQGERDEYFTLSHCWGKLLLSKSTTANIDTRKSGITMSELSITFQQAVQITQALGIRYLWIDSLCILQDSKQDWEEEASKMADIYANSTLNLAATSAANGAGGIFNQRWTPGYDKDVRHSVRSYEIPGSEQFGCMHYIRHCFKRAHDDLSLNTKPFQRWTAPLLSRGWVYQERLLSPRTVHFHESEMSWDCKSQYKCECGSFESDPHVPRQIQGVYQWFSKRTLAKVLDESPYSIFAAWNMLVKQYSSLSLTEKSDRLPALSGLASRFQGALSQYPSSNELPYQYLAGLWRQNLEKDLLWFVVVPAGAKLPRRAHPYRAPSWSWASLELQEDHDVLTAQKPPQNLGAIDCIIEGHSEFKVDAHLEILDAFCTVSGRNDFGAVSAGTLSIRGIVLGLGLWSRAAFNSRTRYRESGHLDSLIRADFRIDLQLDDENYYQYTNHMIPVYVLLLGTTLDYTHYNSERPYVGLVLIKAQKNSDWYLRVGVAQEIRRTDCEIAEIEPSVIKIA